MCPAKRKRCSLLVKMSGVLTSVNKYLARTYTHGDMSVNLHVFILICIYICPYVYMYIDIFACVVFVELLLHIQVLARICRLTYTYTVYIEPPTRPAPAGSLWLRFHCPWCSLVGCRLPGRASEAKSGRAAKTRQQTSPRKALSFAWHQKSMCRRDAVGVLCFACEARLTRGV